MPRPNKADERRRELLPLVAEAFGDLGYRRATTAEIASRCDVQENILYRLWSDKKAMFIASIDYLFVRRMEKWQSHNAAGEKANSQRASRLIQLTSEDLGEAGLYRIIFTALSETDDPDVKRALQRLYKRYHERVKAELRTYYERQDKLASNEDAATAWALIGLVAFMNIVVDLDLMSGRKRRELFTEISFRLLGDPP